MASNFIPLKEYFKKSVILNGKSYPAGINACQKKKTQGIALFEKCLKVAKLTMRYRLNFQELLLKKRKIFLKKIPK